MFENKRTQEKVVGGSQSSPKFNNAAVVLKTYDKTLMENLEAAQQEMSERQKVARSRQEKKTGGTKKPKRARRSVISLLTELASHPDARSRDRLRANQKILLFTGKSVLPT